MFSSTSLNVYVFAALISSCTPFDWVNFKHNHVAIPGPLPRIIGGNEAKPHAYPYQVGILINGDAFCGGSLISQNYVLTAAHCAIVISSEATVILGAHNLTADESSQVNLTLASGGVIIHENFNFTSYQNDIALLKLSKAAPLNDVIKIISLPSRQDVNNTYIDKVTTSTGWGLTADVDYPTIRDMSTVLMVVQLDVVTYDECDEVYNHYGDDVLYVTDNNICTSGYKNKGTCNGDSGGPLAVDGVQVGLVSIGTTLCEVCAPSVFTKIAKYLDWIEAHSDVVIP